MSEITGNVDCPCGYRVVSQTSWKYPNCGRRFFSCSNWNIGKGCNYFDWAEPPMCHRSQQIIPGLLNRVNEKRNEIKMMQAEIEKMQVEITKHSNLIEKNKILKAQVNNLKKAKKRSKMHCVLLLVLLIFTLLFCTGDRMPQGTCMKMLV
ncbi:GRF zinc finger family protein [Striga asiatica]|uniref:GRF zinc finger family protein n=1 Tax=Striga asiatica TaxID=4170 RepID=A0A5A7Q473_STRAF|nr:GRF zinc finger family protein [Striga asiatica]